MDSNEGEEMKDEENKRTEEIPDDNEEDVEEK